MEKDAIDEVLRKIGRNLLLFQQIEGMLKLLVANGRVRGYAKDFEHVRSRSAASVRTQSMGQLVGQFTETVLTNVETESAAPEELEGAWISFSFTLDADSTFYKQQAADLATMVAERNELVHHFLPSWDPSSPESTETVGQRLDRQREKVLPIRDYLQDRIQDLRYALRAQAEFIASDEGQRQLELGWLQQSRLVLLLGDIAQQQAGADGWMPLARAGQLLRVHAPEEVAVLKERYGHKTLKELLLAADLFEVRDEPTANGGFRAVYRIKPEWMLGPLRPESNPPVAS
jgi:hypothetical protein